MPRKITEKLREQRRLACARYYSKKRSEGFSKVQKWIKKDNKCSQDLNNFSNTNGETG